MRTLPTSTARASRRQLLTGLAGVVVGAASGTAPTVAAVPVADGATGGARVAVLDWGLAETCLAFGCAPVGVPAPGWYDRYAVEPPMPSGTTDVGLLFTPNFELLQALQPDALVITPVLLALRAQLGRIAPLVVSTLSQAGIDALEAARAGTLALAARLGRTAAAAALVDTTEAALAQARARLEAHMPDRPILVVTALDERHVNVFTTSGLIGAVLSRLGLRNAWTASGTASFVTLGVEQLASLPDATIVAVAAGGGDRLPVLAKAPLWKALPPVEAGRVLRLAPVLDSGGLPAASRLARLLADALTASRGRGRE